MTSSNQEVTRPGSFTEERSTSGPLSGCATDRLLKLIAKAWTAHLLWLLGRNGPMRFGALRRALPGAVSAKVLSGRLRELEQLGLVRRLDESGAQPAVSYVLTDEGREIDRILRLVETEAERLPLASIDSASAG